MLAASAAGGYGYGMSTVNTKAAIQAGVSKYRELWAVGVQRHAAWTTCRSRVEAALVASITNAEAGTALTIDNHGPALAVKFAYGGRYSNSNLMEAGAVLGFRQQISGLVGVFRGGFEPFDMTKNDTTRELNFFLFLEPLAVEEVVPALLADFVAWALATTPMAKEANDFATWLMTHGCRPQYGKGEDTPLA